MKRSVLRIATVVLALISAPLIAQGVNRIEGIYTGKGEGNLKVDLKHIQNDIYRISISTVVPMRGDQPGCGGGIEGEVILKSSGGNFFVENEDFDPGANSPARRERYCEIGLKLDGKGGMKLEERTGCISYHGAACGFTGRLTHDAAGI